MRFQDAAKCAMALGVAAGLTTACSMFRAEQAEPELVTVVPAESDIFRPTVNVIPPEPSPPPREYATYVVQKGDTLSGIAWRYGVRVSDITEINSMANPNRIRIGQEVLLPAHARQVPRATRAKPAASVPRVSAGGEGAYVIKPGDTLSEIALAHGTTVEALRRANNLSGDRIVAGKTLVIPGQEAAAGAGSAPPSSLDEWERQDFNMP